MYVCMYVCIYIYILLIQLLILYKGPYEGLLRGWGGTQMISIRRLRLKGYTVKGIAGSVLDFQFPVQ